MKKNTQSNVTRRKFIKSGAAFGSLSLMPGSVFAQTTHPPENTNSHKSIIGSYGEWACNLVRKPPQLSFRNNKWKDLKLWKNTAINKASELISSPDTGDTPKVTVNKKYVYQGLEIEELSWQLPYGRATEAYFIKPKNAKGPLPAILGLHDHGGNKYFGKRKITRTSDQVHPKIIEHQKNYYEGAAWANEIAKKGYAVLVHDTFSFGSRRVLFEEMSEIPWGNCATEGMSDDNPEESQNIDIYNSWAQEHEHILSKSLFCGGTTWPGVTLAEDQKALDVLCARDDIDANQVGCAGLSGGGLRTVYLGGLDERIKCAVCVGFMTTWKDFLLYKAYTHTWMIYTPLIPKLMEFPEVLGLRAPLPTMTLNNNQDRLFTPSEMKKANKILEEVFEKASAPEKYKGAFYQGDHKFDLQMQHDAFEWFDKWLK